MDNLIIREVSKEELEEMARQEYFKEDKAETVRALFETLKTTRAFHNILTEMTYHKHVNGDESVTCFFKYSSGSVESVNINVTADSCSALIQDVWKRLYEMV